MNKPIIASEMKSFRLSKNAVNTIEKLSQRFTEESKIRISMAKVVEIAIFFIEKKNLNELLKIK
jgi:hypothetical protein